MRAANQISGVELGSIPGLRRKIHVTLILFLINCALPNPVHAQTLVSSNNLDSVSNSNSENQTGSEPDETESLTDQKAKVFNVTGKVTLLRQDTDEWVPLHENDIITEGDKIKTEGEASVEIYYDDFYLNFIRVQPTSEITFTTIEPTSISLADGGIFNNLDGLIAGSEYEIVTPTSISAVRGTRFLREFNRSDSSDNTLVSEGTVDVNPFLADGVTPDLENSFQVRANESMFFDAASVRERNFQHLKPTPMKAENQRRLTNMRTNAQKKLNRFAGGEQHIKAAQKRFQGIKNNPEKMNRVQHRLREGPQSGMSQRSGMNRDGQAHQAGISGNKQQNRPQGSPARNQLVNEGSADRGHGRGRVQDSGSQHQGSARSSSQRKRNGLQNRSSENRQGGSRKNGSHRQNMTGQQNARREQGHGFSGGKNRPQQGSGQKQNSGSRNFTQNQPNRTGTGMNQKGSGTNSSSKRNRTSQNRAPKS